MVEPTSFARLLLLCVVCSVAPASADRGEAPARPVREKLIMGWLESVFLKPWNLRVTAKLDTGAKTSSLHADRITHFTRDGKEWVRFTLTETENNKELTVERPLVRTAYVKERKARSSKRDVVKVVICKNGRNYETEFTLVDRSNFNYLLLLGRSFLEDVALVDSSATFLYEADDDPCRTDVSAKSRPGKAR